MDGAPSPAGDGVSRPRMPPWAWALGFAAVCGLAWGLRSPERRPPAAPLKTAYWYWRPPFRLDAAERERLAAAGIERLYVLAGTLAARGKRLALVSPQAWKERAPVPAVGVFRVEGPALPLLLAPEGAAQAAALVRSANLPADLAGYQWDADVPTRKLPEYRRFLEGVRKAMPESRLLGITALPDWLTSPDYAALCEAVDEIAPQFYGNSWPKEGREPPSLWEADRLVEQVRRAAVGRARVWVGLPAYGRCLVADRDGRFSGVRHDVDPEPLFDDPLWEVGHASTRVAMPAERGEGIACEDVVLLRSREETLAGHVLFPAATSLWFQWPRVEGLRAAAAGLAQARIPGVEGICLFRWPIRGEALALAPVALAGADSGATGLSVRLQRDGDRVVVVVRNAGTDSPRPAEGVRLEVTPAGGEIDARSEGAGYLGSERVSPLRADRVRFERPVLRPGSRWEPCAVVRPRGTITAELRWSDGQGERVAAVRAGARAEGKATDASR